MQIFDISLHTDYNFIKYLIIETEGKTIGFCQYYDYLKGCEDWHGTYPEKGSYSIDYLIGCENLLEKSHRKVTVKMLTGIFFNETNAERIIVQPDPENIRSLQTLLSAGYLYDRVNDIFFVPKRKLNTIILPPVLSGGDNSSHNCEPVRASYP